jgi:uncharacterized protein (DUF2461 family)
MPMPAELKKIRQEIDYCFDEFKKIITAKKFMAVYGGLNLGADISLVKVPQGFEKDNPAADYLKLKSFIAMRKVTEKELGSGELLKIASESFEALQPFINFLNKALAD